LVKSGGRSEPFVDFRVKLADLSAAQKTSAIGASNYRLLESGTVSWNDIVTETRVRSFTEVAQRAKLDIAAMEKAGVRADHAKHAFDRIHTPKQELIREQRQKLIANIQEAGLSDAQIKEAVSVRIGEKIGIVGGKTAATVTEVSTRRSILPKPLRDILDYFGRKLRTLFRGPGNTTPMLAVESPAEFVAKTAAKARKPKAPKVASVPSRFTTHTEVDDWAKKLFPKAEIKTEGISLESWHAIADELDHLVPKFPGIADNIIGLGASDAVPHGLAWVKPNDIRGDTLNFNPAFWGDTKKVQKTFDKSVKTGWIAEGTENAGPQYFVTHEFGHLVDGYTRRNNRAKYLDAHATFKGADNQFDPSKGGTVSQYAATSSSESFAESFAGARWSNKPSPLVSVIKEMFGL
jgi:hypothetical protein